MTLRQRQDGEGATRWACLVPRHQWQSIHQSGDLRELIAMAKQKPNALSYASSGFGSNNHLAGEMLLALKDRETAEKLLGQGLLVVGNTPEQFSARIRAELDLYTKLAKTLNLRIE